MPPPAAQLWGTYCEVDSKRHDTFYSRYQYCSQCWKFNPNPLPLTIRAASVLASQPQGNSESESHRSSESSGRVSNYQSGHTSFASLPSHAEGQRQLGFKHNQPSIPHAGSRALSRRPPKQTQQLTRAANTREQTGRTLRLMIVLYTQQLSITFDRQKRATWAYDKPERYESWVIPFIERKYEDISKPIFLDWILSERSDLGLLTDFDKHLDHFCVYEWDDESNAPTKIQRAFASDLSFEEIDTAFPSSGKPPNKVCMVNINVLQYKDSRTAQRYHQPQELSHNAASRAASGPANPAFNKLPFRSGSFQLPVDNDEPLESIESINWQLEEDDEYEWEELELPPVPLIKKEKPSWESKVCKQRCLICNC